MIGFLRGLLGQGGDDECVISLYFFLWALSYLDKKNGKRITFLAVFELKTNLNQIFNSIQTPPEKSLLPDMLNIMYYTFVYKD
jgi:hypothetical protein